MAGIILLDVDINPTKMKRICLILALSLGLLAKFFMLPFAAIYLWYRIIEKREWSYFIDAAVILFIVLFFIWPFGWFNVVQSVILFNLNLDVRSEVTAFYFNPIALRETDQFKREVIRYLRKLKPISYEFEELTSFLILRSSYNTKDSLEKIQVEKHQQLIHL